MALTRRTLLRGAAAGALALPMLAACGQVTVTTDEAEAPAAPAEPAKLRIGDLPLIDMLPVYVAQQEGLFPENLEVELVPFSSALERDTAYISKQVDGVLNDFVSATALNRDQDFTRNVRVILRSTPQLSLFALIAGKDSGIEKLEDVKGKQIAISPNTIIEYVLDRMLGTVGLGHDDVEKLAVPSIPLRLEMINQGNVTAAVLPEPLVTLSIATAGTLLIRDDAETQFGASLLSFRSEVIANHEDTVRGFMNGFEAGVNRINSNPGNYQDLMEARGRIPPPLFGKFSVPTFPEAAVVPQAEFEAVGEWAVERGLLQEAIPYEKLVDTRFLPG
ncbi:MAG: MetQ/NlpA family ABC transporter substrate-binding protein [Chloroflexota bacterium]|nr:MetQ/NlpA family ABC transporter substrate-binding protein [Chloroflexota bacterium]MDE2931683.1 MetQ/NlpA family ABC transporter substrate-binding protein [Chloroflexota bacterium]